MLDAARKHYPDSGELATLDAMLLVRAKQTDAADKVLADFVAAHPKDLDVILARARLLSETLKKPAEARALLTAAAATSETTGPLAQLALLEINQNDAQAARAAIAKLRARWKEAAVADLLDAQLAMANHQPRAALTSLDAALKKDPTNKLALFWKAQIDDRSGATGVAYNIYQSIAQENPVKELDEGLSLATAAKWSLATIELQSQNLDTAISRLEDLLKDGVTGERARSMRWQLAGARAAKGDWATAQKDIEALLQDQEATPEDRVRAANLYHLHGGGDRAAALLDEVLKTDPTHTAALALQAYLLAAKQPAQAADRLRKAIAQGKQPPTVYLMLAAVENTLPPVTDGPQRALAIVEQALPLFPDSLELVQAKYRLLRLKGDKDAALAYVEDRAQNDPKGFFQRYLVDVFRDEGRYDRAEKVVRRLLEQTPNDEMLAEQLIRMIGLEALDAANRGDRATEQKLNQDTTQLIKQFRTRFPQSTVFLQAEAELAARTGRLDAALSLTKEIDQLDRNSPQGPMLRAQINTLRGWIEGAVTEYAEAVRRAPLRADLRLALAQSTLAAGKTDEALKQASWVLEAAPDQTTAVLLKARALAARPGTPEQAKASRQEAVALLNKVLANQPKWSAGYHQVAEFQLMDQNRAAAVQTLATALQAVPHDVSGLSMLVQVLSEPRGWPHAPGSPAGRRPGPAICRQRPHRHVDASRLGRLPQSQPARPWPVLVGKSRRQARQLGRAPEPRRPAHGQGGSAARPRRRPAAV